MPSSLLTSFDSRLSFRAGPDMTHVGVPGRHASLSLHFLKRIFHCDNISPHLRYGSGRKVQRHFLMQSSQKMTSW